MKYKLVYQHDERDCGAASLAMILACYGLKLPMAKCRELTNTDSEGTNVYGIIEGAKKVGLNAIALAGNVSELLEGIGEQEVTFPFIAHIVKDNMQGHFVVVTQIIRGRVCLLDPAKGKRKISLEKFSQCWTGNIVCFEKTEKFVAQNLNRGTLLKFFGLLKGQYAKLVSVFVLSLALSFLGIMSAFIFQTIVDEFGVTAGYYEFEEEECTDEDCTEESHEHQEEKNLFIRFINFIYQEAHNYKIFFVGAIMLYLIQGVIQLARSCLMAKVAQKIDMKVTMDYYTRLMQLPMESISTRKTGEYLSRFTDAIIIRDTVSRVMVTVFLDVLMAIACGILLCMQNKEMFAIAVCIMTLHFVVVIAYHKPLERINRELMESSAEVEAYVKETIDGIETLKVNCSEDIFIKRGKKKYHEVTKMAWSEEVFAESQNIMSELIDTIGSIIIIWVGFGLVLQNVISIGSLLSFFIILSYFTSPIKNLIQLQPMIQTAVIAAERLSDIIELSLEQDEGTQKLASDWQRIHYVDVSFQYGNSASVLNHVNFSIEKGQKIAIVGESGSGKTSLAKLLVRLYTPDTGKILIDNQELQLIPLSEVRNRISYISQDAYLFSDSIKNNLSLHKYDISEEDLESAGEYSTAKEIIQELPYKYDTALTERAQNISAGQRQRLLIARALLRKPDVMILDEATSNLDWGCEAEIKENLFKNKELTVIVISHRLSSIVDCDNIIVLDKGTVVETGTHKELLAERGVYFKLWERQ